MNAKHPTTSAEERKRREDAANFARASVALDGFMISAECEAHTQRYINGEISTLGTITPSNLVANGVSTNLLTPPLSSFRISTSDNVNCNLSQ